MVAARHIAMDQRAIATPTVAAPRTPLDKARPTIAPTAPAHHTTTVEAQLTRMLMMVRLRANTAKGRLTRTPMGAALQLNTGRARRIRTFMEVPLRGITEKVHITPVPMVTALRIIHPPPTMAIIRPPRSTTTDQHAPIATVGPLPQPSQPPLLLVRLSLQQMQTLPMLTPMLRQRQPTPTTPDTTPAQPRVTRLRQSPIP